MGFSSASYPGLGILYMGSDNRVGVGMVKGWTSHGSTEKQCLHDVYKRRSTRILSNVPSIVHKRHDTTVRRNINNAILQYLPSEYNFFAYIYRARLTISGHAQHMYTRYMCYVHDHQQSLIMDRQGYHQTANHAINF
jgi:hypothetical protein